MTADIWEVPNLSPGQLAVLADIEKTLEVSKEAEQYNKFLLVDPYPKQKEFLAAGATCRQRMFNAGNQLGKSWTGALEMTYHLTGIYPKWWEGRRFTRPIVAWAAGVSARDTRDVSQRHLCGEPLIGGRFGTGMIPRDKFVGPPTLGRGITGAYDMVQVRHASGGVSVCFFKSYEQGREKFQGASVDVVWLDEEPDYPIYTECLTRTVATGGMVFLTYTPLTDLGENSELWQAFQNPLDKAKKLITMTYLDVLDQPNSHLGQDAYDELVISWPAHERETRMMGKPLVKGGLVFQFAREAISCPPIHEPGGYVTGGIGLDFGGAGGTTLKYSHASAAVMGIYDKTTDIIYVMRAAKVQGGDWLALADTIKTMSSDAIVFWPHDGHRQGHDGDTTADQLRKRGINMFGVHAQFPRGGYDTENGILLMQHRFQTGRLKICDNLTEWWGEYGAYGRDEKGEINKIRDDLLSATRILVMMLPRYGRTFRLGVAPPTGWRGPAGGSQSKRWTPEPEGGYFGLDP